MPKLIKKEKLFLKQQPANGNLGTRATLLSGGVPDLAEPLGSDFAYAYDMEYTYEGGMVERTGYGGNLGRAGDIYAGMAGNVKFMMDVRAALVRASNDIDLIPPAIANVLLAAGMRKVPIGELELGDYEEGDYDSSSSGDERRGILQTYALNSDPHYMQLLFDQDGLRRRMFDCATSSLSLSATAGEVVKLEANLMGRIWGGSEVAGNPIAVPDDTIMDTVPIVARGAMVTVRRATGNNANLVENTPIEAVSLDWGLSVSQNRDIADSEGYARPVLTDRNPMITINPEQVNEVWHSFQRDNQDFHIEVALGEGGNRIVINMPKARLVEQSDGDRNGIRTQELKFQLARTDGNDEFSIDFDPAA